VDLSIVIATRDRRALLGASLASLEAAGSGGLAGTEVVVVDHGSRDDTAELLAGYDARLPLRTIALPFRGESIAEPKNAGVAAARGDVVAFVDSGVVCAPGFAAAHRAAHRAPGSRCVAGAVLGWDSEDTTEPFWATVEPARMPQHPGPTWPEFLRDPRAGRFDPDGPASWLLMWGANLSMLRAVLVAEGAFDTGMSGWGWDDLELAFRLSRAGLRPHYAPDAWGLHLPHSRAPLAARMATSQRNWLRAYARHAAPELELWDRCDFWDYPACLQRLRGTWHEVATTLPTPPPRPAGTGTRVLLGFAPPTDPDEADVYVLPPGSGAPHGVAVSAFGLRTPLPDGAADVAVVSPALLAFDWAPAPGWPTLAEVMVREAARVAARVDAAGPGVSALVDRAAA